MKAQFHRCALCDGTSPKNELNKAGQCTCFSTQPMQEIKPIQPASDLSAAMWRVVERAKARAFTVVELIFVLFIVAILYLLIYDGHRKETVQMPSAFAAWEKQTGNEKHLTYEEWRSLMRANEKKSDTTFIFIPQ